MYMYSPYYKSELACYIILVRTVFVLLDEYLLKKSPKVTDAYRFLTEASVRWNEIGMELEVRYDYRQQLFREGIQSTTEEKLDRVLSKWAETNCSEVTWGYFLEMLKRLQLNRIADEVKQFLQSDSGKERYRNVPQYEVKVE